MGESINSPGWYAISSLDGRRRPLHSCDSTGA